MCTHPHILMHHCSLVPEVDCCPCQQGSVMCLMPEVTALSCLFAHRGLCVLAEDCSIQGRNDVGYCKELQDTADTVFERVHFGVLHILISNSLIM